jgi:hypothetical protein
MPVSTAQANNNAIKIQQHYPEDNIRFRVFYSLKACFQILLQLNHWRDSKLFLELTSFIYLGYQDIPQCLNFILQLQHIHKSIVITVQ